MNEPVIQGNYYLIWVVVLAYMAIITGAGSYYARYMKSADAYFKAGNQIPWWAAGISMYMANFTAYTFVAIASLVYMRGLPALLLETGPALAFALGAIFLAQRWHRLNLTSPPEYLEARFNPATRQTFSILGILSKLIGNGIRLLSMCKFLESVTGIPAEIMIVVTGVVVIFYTVMGGLWAVIVTDVLQFIVLLLAVIPMLILSIAHIFIDSSWSEFVASIPAGYASFPNTNPVGAYGGVPVEAGPQWGWLMAFWFAYLLDYNGDWGVIQRMCCTPTEKDAKKAAWLSAFLSVPHAFLLLGCCFIARVLWGDAIADPSNVQESELIYGRVATRLLPAGLIGVVAAAMFSATMSTLNVAWAVMSTSFVNDIWRRFIHKDAHDRELILVGRVAVTCVGGIAIAAALVVALTETDILGFAQSMIALVVTPMLIPLVLGILLPRTHEYAALAGMLGALLFGVLNKTLFHLPFEWEITLSALTCVAIMWGSSHRYVPRSGLIAALLFWVLNTTVLKLPFGWIIAVSALSCFGVMLATTLLPTTPSYRERVAHVFQRMRTPRAPEPVEDETPPPLPIVGAFMLLIGALVFLLVFTPQPLLDRILTFVAAAVLACVGLWLRRVRQPLEPLVEPDTREAES